MTSWKSLLKSDPTDWLLEPDNPSVRSFTLTEILEKAESSTEVKKAKAGIMKTGIVPRILSAQTDEGCWETPEKFYTAKYKGTVWQLLILAELGADGRNPQIKKACEFIIGHSQDHESGGYAINESAKNGGGRHSEVIPCLTGNLLWSLIKFGYLKDERIQKGIDWIDKYQRFDDGVAAPPKGWPYDKFEMCWGKHSCHMGVVKTLKALSAIPSPALSKTTRATIDNGMEYLLIHHIYKKSHDYNSISKPGWLRLGFPLMYQTDLLEMLRILTTLNCRDERMQDAINIILSKQDREGRWNLENTFNGKFIVDMEPKGKSSKWITLHALRVLKSYYGK